MHYYSTRNKNLKFTLEEALLKGLAPDDGLFVPKELIKIKNIDQLKELKYSELAYEVLKPFFKDSTLEKSLKDICNNAFNFDLEINMINERLNILELFHGPTLSFKDFGARFLAQCISKIDKKITIITATSGDTGGAVASAFHKVDNVNVKILYPLNGVSEEQRSQLNYWKDNIESYAIDGSFDECQKIIKDSFKESKNTNLSSANSINIGRLLGQITYYAYTSLQKPNSDYIIPSGNMGNALACIWAKELGFPIENIVLACNSNKSIKHFFNNMGELKKFETINTVANAMDVGLPSNLERLKDLKSINDLKKYIREINVSDSDIVKTIIKTLKEDNYLCDPHTATAIYAYNNLTFKNNSVIAVSTAHPIKFKNLLVDLNLDQHILIPKRSKELFQSNFKDNLIDKEIFKKKVDLI